MHRDASRCVSRLKARRTHARTIATTIRTARGFAITIAAGWREADGADLLANAVSGERVRVHKLSAKNASPESVRRDVQIRDALICARQFCST